MDEPVADLVTATVTPVPDLTEQQIVMLARDMAWAIKPPDKLLEALNISPEQFNEHILTNGYYKRAYSAFLVEWESATSTNKRLAVKSATALEMYLPEIAARMSRPGENLTGVVETAKLFAKLAGAGEPVRQEGAGERFTININLGAKKIELSETLRSAPEIVGEIREIPESEITPATLRSLPKREGS